MKNENNTKDMLGKALFAVAFIVLLFTVYVAFRYPFLSVDEWFTKGLIKLPLLEGIRITIIDVHPPLYYVLLKGFTGLFSGFDMDILLKLFSLIPYAILYVLSITVIRKNYGWLTGGFFAFSLLAMSNFFMRFLTARMYSWGLLFLILGFLCIRAILEKNDIRYWILLSVFSLMGAYTHYYIAFSSIILYVILFGEAVMKHREYLKNWIISAALGIILYVPWLRILFGQINHVSGTLHKPVTFPLILRVYDTLFYTPASTTAAGIVLLIALIALFGVYHMKNRDDIDGKIALIAIVTVFLTVIMGILASKFKSITEPYVVPAASLVWLSVSILLAKADFKKVILPVIIICLVIGAVNISTEMHSVEKNYNMTVKTYDMLEKINSPENIIVYDGMQKYIRFYDYLNETMQFHTYNINNHTSKGDRYVNILGLNNTQFNIPSDLEKYPGKKLYFIYEAHYNMTDNITGHDTKETRLYNCKFAQIT